MSFLNWCRSRFASHSAIAAFSLCCIVSLDRKGNAQTPQAGTPQKIDPTTLTDSRIFQARDQGVQYLKEKIKSQEPSYQFVSALAMLKSDVSADTPEVRETVELVLKSFNSDRYSPGSRHVYEASVALMCLANADREKFKPQIQQIAVYILSRQEEAGGWDYPVGAKGRAFGDNSITQFALLSLWEARRSGVKIPGSVWERCALWLMKSNNSDGGYPYHPQEGDHPSIHTMSAAAAGSMLIIRHQLFPQLRVPFTPQGEPTSVPTGKRFGVLQSNLGEEGFHPTFEVSRLDEKIKGSIEWQIEHYIEEPNFQWAIYHLYAVERFCALGYMPQIGTHDWYREGAAFLLSRQRSDGSWTDDLLYNTGTDFWSVSATSLAVMFLTKATAKMVEPPIGTGLLVGGRGLPEDLKNVQFNDGKAKAQKSLGSVDDLLSELENPKSEKIASLQANIIDKVLQDRPEDLIRQKERLKNLAVDPRAGVRQTAMWALGRSSDLRSCRILIDALRDSDPQVAIEASVSLRILSRKLRGIGLTDGEFKPDQEYAAWNAWYRSVRPYDERDDLIRNNPDRDNSASGAR